MAEGFRPYRCYPRPRFLFRLAVGYNRTCFYNAGSGDEARVILDCCCCSSVGLLGVLCGVEDTHRQHAASDIADINPLVRDEAWK